MYLVLNSTDAARALNGSARPAAPVIGELASKARRDLPGDLALRVSLAGERLTRRLRRNGRAGHAAALSHS